MENGCDYISSSDLVYDFVEYANDMLDGKEIDDGDVPVHVDLVTEDWDDIYPELVEDTDK